MQNLFAFQYEPSSLLLLNRLCCDVVQMHHAAGQANPDLALDPPTSLWSQHTLGAQQMLKLTFLNSFGLHFLI